MSIMNSENVYSVNFVFAKRFIIGKLLLSGKPRENRHSMPASNEFLRHTKSQDLGACGVFWKKLVDGQQYIQIHQTSRAFLLMFLISSAPHDIAQSPLTDWPHELLVTLEISV